MEPIAPLLEKLAIQLGVTAENLWQILMFQARLTWILPTLIAIALITVGIVIRHLSKDCDKCDENGWKGITAAMYLVSLIPGVIAAWFGLLAIINPAYLALNKILSVLTPIAK